MKEESKKTKTRSTASQGSGTSKGSQSSKTGK